MNEDYRFPLPAEKAPREGNPEAVAQGTASSGTSIVPPTGPLNSHTPTPDARASGFTRDRLAQAVEAEIERLRELRPHLESRLDRAGSLLVAQLSVPPRSRPVKIRVTKDGKVRYLVSSLSSPGVVYEVDCKSYSCSCPDAHRHGKGCKHALTVFLLRRAARRSQVREKPPACSHCMGSGWVYLGSEVVDEATGEVSEAINPVRCRRCASVSPPYLTDSELEEWMDEVRWIEAVTMPAHPHSYTLKKEQDPTRFERVVKTIWDEGYDRMYLNRPWRTLDVGEHYVWVHTLPSHPLMPAPVEITILINRAERVQERIL